MTAGSFYSVLGSGLVLGCAAATVHAPTPVASGMPSPVQSPAINSRQPEQTSAQIPAGSLRLAWTHDTKSWNRAIAITPSGDVVSVGTGKLHLHARDTGNVVEATQACFVKSRRALAFVAPNRVVLACSEGVLEVNLPELRTQMVTKTEELTVAAAASATHVAYALRGGEIRVLRNDGYITQEIFSAGGEVEELALSIDGRMLAIGRRDGFVLVRSRGHGLRTVEAKGDRRATGLSFSRDGSLLFVNNESFGARVYRTATGRLERRHRLGPWVSASADLGWGWFATSGSDGVMIFRPNVETGQKVQFGPAGPTASCEGLDSSEDGSLLCTGDRHGRVACFTTKPLESSSGESAHSDVDGTPQ